MNAILHQCQVLTFIFSTFQACISWYINLLKPEKSQNALEICCLIWKPLAINGDLNLNELKVKIQFLSHNSHISSAESTGTSGQWLLCQAGQTCNISISRDSSQEDLEINPSFHPLPSRKDQKLWTKSYVTHSRSHSSTVQNVGLCTPSHLFFMLQNNLTR